MEGVALGGLRGLLREFDHASAHLDGCTRRRDALLRESTSAPAAEGGTTVANVAQLEAAERDYRAAREERDHAVAMLAGDVRRIVQLLEEARTHYAPVLKHAQIVATMLLERAREAQGAEDMRGVDPMRISIRLGVREAESIITVLTHLVLEVVQAARRVT